MMMMMIIIIMTSQVAKQPNLPTLTVTEHYNNDYRNVKTAPCLLTVQKKKYILYIKSRLAWPMFRLANTLPNQRSWMPYRLSPILPTLHYITLSISMLTAMLANISVIAKLVRRTLCGLTLRLPFFPHPALATCVTLLKVIWPKNAKCNLICVYSFQNYSK